MAVVEVVRVRAKPCIRERPGATVRNEGYAAKGTPVPTDIQAHIQPLSAQEIRDLPPGQNAIDWRNIWSESDLALNDRITRATGGDTFTVKRTEYWEEGQFYRAAAVIVRDTV